MDIESLVTEMLCDYGVRVHFGNVNKQYVYAVPRSLNERVEQGPDFALVPRPQDQDGFEAFDMKVVSVVEFFKAEDEPFDPAYKTKFVVDFVSTAAHNEAMGAQREAINNIRKRQRQMAKQAVMDELGIDSKLLRQIKGDE